MSGNNFFIDSHQHFWKFDPVKYSWIPDRMHMIRRDFLPIDLEPILKENDIQGCIAVQGDQSEAETRFLLDLAGNNNFIKGVVGWVDLNDEKIKERLNLFSENPFFKGVRHTVYDDAGEFMLQPSFQRGISCLGSFGLTYDILVFDYQLPGAVELGKKFPNQPFVLDHMGKPQISNGLSKEWRSYIRELGKCKNVYCKVSGLVTETENFQWEKKDFFPFLEEVISAFGKDRLMFGSDWPVCLSAASYAEILEIIKDFFSEEDLKGIMGGNAVKFYNLKIGNENIN